MLNNFFKEIEKIDVWNDWNKLGCVLNECKILFLRFDIGEKIEYYNENDLFFFC